MIVANDTDDVMAKARASYMAIIQNSERAFVDSVVNRGVLTTEQALSVVDEHRPTVLEALDENMKNLRAWILRGGTDTH